jgi:hypothetical protein
MSELRNGKLFDFGKETSETIYSRIITNILGDESFNKLHFTPIALLLRLIANNAIDDMLSNIKVDFDTQLANSLLKASNDITIESIDTEVTVENGKRADIVVLGNSECFGKFMLCIENKVRSTEHDKQCADYYTYLTKVYQNRKYIFTYLAPYKPDLNAQGGYSISDAHFVPITYNELLNEVLIVIQTHCKIQLEIIPKRSYELLSDFISTIQQIEIKGQNIAMSTEKVQLLEDFWNSNKDLILQAVNLFADSNEIQIISDNAKKRNNKSWAVKSKPGIVSKDLSMREVVRQVVEHLAETLTSEELAKALNQSGIKVIFTSPTKTSINKDFPTVSCKDGVVVYVSNQWTSTSFDIFKKLVKKYGIVIKP